MEIWQLWGITGVILFILEMFTPALFFLNLALAALVTAVAVYFVPLTGTVQITIFVVLSALMIAFLRPLLLKVKNEPEQSGVKASYYGKEAKVTQKITANGGRITIFGEAWDARSVDGSEIYTDSTVRIVRCENLTMYVEKI